MAPDETHAQQGDGTIARSRTVEPGHINDNRPAAPWASGAPGAREPSRQLYSTRGPHRSRCRPTLPRPAPARSCAWSIRRGPRSDTSDYVDALAVSGSDLYVGGGFSNAAGIPQADNVARWDGAAWSALGSNGHGNGAFNDSVFALAVSGDNLYAGGVFVNAAGIPAADYIARWNGSAWSALGSNGTRNGAALNAQAFALAVSGTNLYVGGRFTNAAGIPAADTIARWNGSAWTALGSNGAGGGALKGEVDALAVSGTGLYAGGGFTNAAGMPQADYIAGWNGSTWFGLGSNGPVMPPTDLLATTGPDPQPSGWLALAAGLLGFVLARRRLAARAAR